MKAIDDINIKEIIDEYINYGLKLNLFNKSKSLEIKIKLLNLEIIYDDILPGDAKVNNNTITINRKRTFKTKKYAELVLFHEFTHKCNCIHQDIYSDNSNFKKFRDYSLNKFNISIPRNDINNPNEYFLYGLLMIDEVISEYVSNLMISYKYKEKNTKTYTRMYKNNILKYTSDFEYYGIGQSLVDLFSKTLFLPSYEKNILGLCKRCFNDNFVNELIYQHFESEQSIRGLFDELSYMGVVCFDEEKRQGRLTDRQDLDKSFIYNSYLLAQRALYNGLENREMIPRNINKPWFLK